MLTIDWTSEEAAPVSLQLLAVAVHGDSGAVERRFGAAVARAAVAARFTGRPGEKFAFTRESNGELQAVTLLGVGADALGAGGLRKLGHDATRASTSVGATHLALDLRDLKVSDKLLRSQVGSLIAQGLELGTYRYERYIAEAKRRPATVQRVTVIREGGDGDGSTRGQTIASSVVRARDLVNGPANLVTPTYLAKFAEEIVKDLKGQADVKLTVLEREDCEKLGMGCYLAVAQGSDQPPKFIHLQYKPRGESKGRVVFIGKGVTFDSGGYSLKPSDAMMGMKMDMGGAAAVICAFEGAARLGVAYEVHAIVAATENMVNGKAYKLGDVLTASNGKTVEIDNTDAEGRLTLADALVYASKLNPTYTFDFATLTGACIIALGPHIAGLMSHDDELAGQFMGAAERAGEDMWRLPLPEALKEQLKSPIADMRNTGERWGGTITAGLFLSEFIEGQRWVHVDIAGPAMVRKPFGVNDEGGSGFAVATMLEFLR
ncbi:MAG: leucyl aminopeptidase [Myxococcales bacterium]|nr:leucyl aminopeptidase [Myxococcales bacterium]